MDYSDASSANYDFNSDDELPDAPGVGHRWVVDGDLFIVTLRKGHGFDSPTADDNLCLRMADVTGDPLAAAVSLGQKLEDVAALNSKLGGTTAWSDGRQLPIVIQRSLCAMRKEQISLVVHWPSMSQTKGKDYEEFSHKKRKGIAATTKKLERMALHEAQENFEFCLVELADWKRVHKFRGASKIVTVEAPRTNSQPRMNCDEVDLHWEDCEGSTQSFSGLLKESTFAKLGCLSQFIPQVVSSMRVGETAQIVFTDGAKGVARLHSLRRKLDIDLTDHITGDTVTTLWWEIKPPVPTHLRPPGGIATTGSLLAAVVPSPGQQLICVWPAFEAVAPWWVDELVTRLRPGQRVRGIPPPWRQCQKNSAVLTCNADLALANLEDWEPGLALANSAMLAKVRGVLDTHGQRTAWPEVCQDADGLWEIEYLDVLGTAPPAWQLDDSGRLARSQALRLIGNEMLVDGAVAIALTVYDKAAETLRFMAADTVNYSSGSTPEIFISRDAAARRVLATIHANKAAAFLKMQKWWDVIRECDKMGAQKIDDATLQEKVKLRKAEALRRLGRLVEALEFAPAGSRLKQQLAREFDETTTKEKEFSRKMFSC